MGFNLAFKELKFGGQYLVVWCVPSATQVTRIHQIQNKVFGFRMFVTLIFEVYSYSRSDIDSIHGKSYCDWRPVKQKRCKALNEEKSARSDYC
jgi:hypothetical protein